VSNNMMAPRIGLYAHRLSGPAAEIVAARTGRYCFIVSNRWEQHVSELRNHAIYVAQQLMPQCLPISPSPWEPWNLNHRLQRLVAQNDWWLRTASGNIVSTGGWGPTGWVNFAKAGVGVGLATEIGAWARGEGLQGGRCSWNALIFELWARTIWPGWLGTQFYNLDANRDQLPDHPAEVEFIWKSGCDQFTYTLKQLGITGRNFPIVVGGDSFSGHLSAWNGQNIEDIFVRQAWPREFHGWNGRGFKLAHTLAREPAMSFLHLLWHRWSPADWARMQRLAIATSCLLDSGIAVVSPYNPEEPQSPRGIVAHEWMGPAFKLGDPLGSHRIADGIYTRDFQRGSVRVDPGAMDAELAVA